MTENMKQKKTFSDFWKVVVKVLKIIKKEFITFPLFILTSPFKAFDEFKRDKKGKLWVACVFIGLLILLNILGFRFTGFIVNPTKKVTDLNPLYEAAKVVLVIVVITIANWSFTTLFDGKGKMKEIFTMLGYALFPLIITQTLGLIISNLVTQSEVAIYNLCITIGTFLMCYIAFFGFISIHEYGVLKSIGSLVATALAVLVICFGVLLAFDLFQKMSGFAYTIYQEFTLRYM